MYGMAYKKRRKGVACSLSFSNIVCCCVTCECAKFGGEVHFTKTHVGRCKDFGRSLFFREERVSSIVSGGVR